MDDPILSVRDLVVEFRTEHGTVKAVNGLSFDLARGETLAILGESGSGKSVTAAAIMDIIDSPPGRITNGSIRFEGEELLRLPSWRRRQFNGAKIAMVFQDALVALNPVYSVGWQITEMLRTSNGLDRGAAQARAIDLLDRVGIPAAARRVNDYPHEFSGGQRQRVMIAMAIALEPRILIADEPTTALDVTVQAQILDLLDELKRETGLSLVLISHDLGVVAEAAERVAVMYAGRIVESALVDRIYAEPRHPYTMGLLQSQPRYDRRQDQLVPIPGTPPDLTRLPEGCAFYNRCRFKIDACLRALPPLNRVALDHHSRCLRESLHDGDE